MMAEGAGEVKREAVETGAGWIPGSSLKKVIDRVTIRFVTP